MTDPIPGPGQAKPARRSVLRRLLLGAAFAVTFVAGGFLAGGLPAAAFDAAMDHGGMPQMAQMAQGHMDRMLNAVDATPDQKERIHVILKTAMESIGPLHQRLAASHPDLHRILTAPVIDRAALEQLRVADIADVDQGSKVMLNAVADAAEVLRPEQRVKLAALIGQRHHMHP
jgi:protein CpxP